MLGTNGCGAMGAGPGAIPTDGPGAMLWGPGAMLTGAGGGGKGAMLLEDIMGAIGGGVGAMLPPPCGTTAVGAMLLLFIGGAGVGAIDLGIMLLGPMPGTAIGGGAPGWGAMLGAMDGAIVGRGASCMASGGEAAMWPTGRANNAGATRPGAMAPACTPGTEGAMLLPGIGAMLPGGRGGRPPGGPSMTMQGICNVVLHCLAEVLCSKDQGVIGCHLANVTGN